MANNPIQTDASGNRFRLKQLKQPQTQDAQLGFLRSHYSEHPSRGLTPAKLADILLAAEQGDLIAQAELAEDMEEKDGHLFAELQKRRRALLGVDWHITPPKNASAAEKRDAEQINELLDNLNLLEDIIFDASDAILKGFACQEIKWQQRDGLWLPEQISFRDPSWFMTYPATVDDAIDHSRNELRLRDNTLTGQALQPFGWIVHRHKTKSGYLARSGLARVLAWPYLFKNYSVRDLAEFLEIYGLPLRLGKYPTGASKDEKNTLLNAVMSIGHNAGGIIPKGMEIDFQEAAKGTQQPFEYMVSLMEKTMSKAILGGTLTSQADGKSSTNALGNVHNEVREELRNSDLKQIAQTLSRDLILPLYMLNGKSYQVPHRSPQFEFELTEPEDLQAFASALPQLVDIGFKIPTQWAQEKVQIPLPQKDEAVLGRSQATPKPKASSDNAKQALSRITALKAKTPTEQAHAMDSFSQQLADAMAPTLAGFTGQINELLDMVDSMEALQDELAKLELDTDTATELLQQAIVAAELAGHYDVSEGN